MSDIHWTEASKNTFGLIRDVSLIAILGGLVFYPAAVGDRLDKAGIVGGSAFGIEFKRQVEKNQKQTERAIADAKAVQEQVAESKKDTQDAIAKVDELIAKNPEISADARAIRRDIKASSDILDQAQGTIQTTVDSQQKIVNSQDQLLEKIERRSSGGFRLVEEK